MAFRIEQVDVWMGVVKNEPGAGAALLEALKKAGAKLEFLFARTTGGGKTVAFVAPIKGAGQIKAAKGCGFSKCDRMPSLRIKGPDKTGLASKIAGALGEAGVNIQGFSAMGFGGRCMMYIAFDKADLTKALRILKKAI